MVGNDSKYIVSINVIAELDSLDDISTFFGGMNKGKLKEYNNGDISLELHSLKDSFAFNGDYEVNLIITFATGVASGVVANIIYDALHNYLKRLTINGRRTRISEESIADAIETIKEIAAQHKEIEQRDVAQEDVAQEDVTQEDVTQEDG